MFVKNAAAIKLLAIGTLLVLTSACSTTTISTADNYQRPKSAMGVVYNVFKHEYHKLDQESFDKHQACISTSLTGSNYGNKCDWSTNSARGQVMVADMYRAGSKTCKTLRTSVIDNRGKTFSMTQTACGDGNNWRFIKV
jgi:surface antigen